jgi:Ras-related protein Rab-21
LSKKVNVRKKTVNLSLWDTAGQEKYGALVPVYYKLADGAILLYDVTDEDSFQKVCCSKIMERKG